MAIIQNSKQNTIVHRKTDRDGWVGGRVGGWVKRERNNKRKRKTDRIEEKTQRKKERRKRKKEREREREREREKERRHSVREGGYFVFVLIDGRAHERMMGVYFLKINLIYRATSLEFTSSKLK